MPEKTTLRREDRGFGGNIRTAAGGQLDEVRCPPASDTPAPLNCERESIPYPLLGKEDARR